MSFTASLKSNIHKTLLRVDSSVTKVSKLLFSQVVLLTPSPAIEAPFSVGLLANQWYPRVNGYSDEKNNVKSDWGADSYARVEAIPSRTFYGRDGFISMSNSVGYAYRAEYVGWPAPEWSGRQGPYAMVTTGLAYIKSLGSIPA